ncbi:MAG: hypothetical protein ACYC5O_00765 [Anaerolineae bacterium]
MCWAEFLARLLVTFDLDPIIDLETLVGLAQATDRSGLADVEQEDVEEWLERVR